jgi:tRNA pseudouridine38-40 synthase
MRYAVGIEYDGTSFSGWQLQKTARTIQGDLSKALSKFANEEIIPIGCGRTDAGVHAKCQVAHFDTEAERSLFQWRSGVNALLPEGISIQWVSLVDQNFHARMSATFRTYRYTIINQSYRSPLNERYAWLVMQSLDDNLMSEGLQYLLGTHDFSCFRASGCQSKTPIRHMLNAQLIRRDQSITIELKASAFLYHMVRNIIGSMVHVGLKKIPPDWIQALINSKDRELAGPTAPAHGLCLYKVEFPNYSFS